jgi:PAS domain S-box-containing protein/putative nucleotidyltransferase with HDIG domain
MSVPLEKVAKVGVDGLQAAIDHLPDSIVFKDTQSVIVFANEAYARDLAVAKEALVGRTEADFLPRVQAEKYRRDDLEVMASGRMHTRDETWVRDGETRWIRITKAPVFDKAGKVEGVILIYRDMTEKKRSQEEVLRQHWALEAISRANKAMVSDDDEGSFLGHICEAVTADNRYSLAWIGWAEDDAAQSVRIVAGHGIAKAYLDGLKTSWGDNANGRGPTGKSIRFNRTEVHNKLIEEETFGPWLERARQAGIRASISVPIRIDNRAAGALVIYGNDFDVFAAREVALFEELADNIAFAVQARRVRAAHEQALLDRAQQAEKLEHALEDALATVAAMLEQRDPYTAGHQRAVAALAVAIGRELGLRPERLKALHLAGIVHDIGKIRVPAEILTKPSRLNAVEFAIVKQHPEVGYNLLKGIDFPWPVADIVRQHHEALDGSGYPLGLRGDAIGLEARIMTVADIVESMSSDRPYRPALGLDQASQEILRLKGSKLDPQVVDACLRVLERGDFVPSLLNIEASPES